jgi:hypothetical protein
MRRLDWISKPPHRFLDGIDENTAAVPATIYQNRRSKAW